MPNSRKLTGAVLLAVAALAGSCITPVPEYVPPAGLAENPKNIILMIGDGMGLAHISAALYANNNRLTLEQFPVVGFHKQHSYDNLITDSAAGATAFACGVKTYNNAIGLTADSIPCKTILEEAGEYGLSTGLVATATIVHATPAAFVAHQKLRIMYEDIAADMLNSGIDMFIGGGKRYFDRRETDNRNLIVELRRQGFQIFDYSGKNLAQIKVDPAKKFAYFTADSYPLSVEAGRNYLPFASRLAAEFLDKHSQGKGFFLMIEGSQIDWGGHARDGRFVIQELMDFDRAVSDILNWAKKRGDTLVIVTGDHESGGMSVVEGSKMGKVKTQFTTNLHTGTMVPVFAYGPKAELFAGIYDNTEIFFKMRRALGFNNHSAKK
jgi:alkaline phosphatase